MWPGLLDERDHSHEVGEDTSDCPNCSLAEKARMLTEFEAFCLVWYYENVSYFTIQTNVLGEMVKELGLKGLRRKLFFRAMNMIHNAELSIEIEKREDEIKKKR